jgi:hypothetical protein
MFKGLLLISLIFTAIVSKGDDGQKVSSKVEKVIVFLDGAQVTRTAGVNISPGTSTLVFGNISPGIDPQSIQVHADGDFTILSVKNELNYLSAEVKQKSVEDLQVQQKIIKQKLELQKDLLTISHQEEAMLLKNQIVTGQNTSLDVLKLKQALDFQTERLTGVKKKQSDVNGSIAALNVELQKYDQQITELNRGNTKITSNILVTVSSKVALKADFILNYVVRNASWYPTYDIRAKNVSSPISIAYKANVTQQSGEDWKNIKLTLSTGNPTVSGSKPEMSPYYLNFGMIFSNQLNKITSVSGSVTAGDDGSALPAVTIRVKGTSIGATTDQQGNYTIPVPDGSQAITYSFIGYQTEERDAKAPIINVALKAKIQNLQEVVVTDELQGRAAGVSVGYNTDKEVRIRGAASIPVIVNQVHNQTNVEFEIDNPYSIPSDGKQYTVEINKLELPATYEYTVAPKLSTDVFLSAQLTDWNKYNFLSGEANLFFEGTYIGKSLLNTNSTSDTLNISLGTDKDILVNRTLSKDLTQKQSLGSNIKVTRDWLITIKNRKNQQINLAVEDQVPVSLNSAIEIETQELSGGKTDPLTGKITWKLILNPADDKKIGIKIPG